MTVEERMDPVLKDAAPRDQFPVGMRVLAVDDDPTCLRLLESLLRRCQYHGLLLALFLPLFARLGYSFFSRCSSVLYFDSREGLFSLFSVILPFSPLLIRVFLFFFIRFLVTTTSQAITALKLLRENKDKFDLVISDVHMPDMDGFKLLELVGLEMDLPVISKPSDLLCLSHQIVARTARLVRLGM